MNSLTPKVCLACNKKIIGRSDKKFCNDYCRNNFNNQQRAETSNFGKNIINALRKNKRILETFLNESDMVKVTKEKLLTAGFLFKYHTHFYETQKGKVYVFCFEYGYLALENDWYLIVKRMD